MKLALGYAVMAVLSVALVTGCAVLLAAAGWGREP